MKINFFAPVYFGKSSKSLQQQWTREQYIKAYQEWDEAGEVYKHTLIGGDTFDSQLKKEENKNKKK